MRNLLQRLGARTGISLGLVLMIATVLVVARLIAGDRAADPTYHPPGSITPSVNATEGDDGQIAAEPTAYADDEAVRSAAYDFASAWLNRTLPAAQWLDGMRPLATDDLIDRLSGVDPLDVPAAAALGPAQIRSRTDVYAEVLLSIGTGDALVLGLAYRDGRWLVTTLDRAVG